MRPASRVDAQTAATLQLHGVDPDDPIFRTPDKAVCPAHTEDEALAAFITEHASSKSVGTAM